MTLLFLIALIKIIWIDVLLSGDNALVIALACQELPARRRIIAMAWGAVGAVLLRVALTGVASTIMQFQYVKYFGAVALFFIASKLLWDDSGGKNVHKSEKLLMAIGAIVLADITMSIDNIVAIAAAANGNLLLLGVGLALSIPLIVTGAAVISSFLDKFPILIWMGAALLGWIAGEMFNPSIVFGVSGATLVLLSGAIKLVRKDAHVENT